MRCLYCNKELALFKRLTGGGEFCSDAHRQKYQEEYNQLALTRLLQASPVPEIPAIPATGAPEVDRRHKTLLDDVVEDPAVPASFELEAVEAQMGSQHAGGQNGGYQNGSSQNTSFEPEPVAVSVESPELEAPAEPSGFIAEIPPPAAASAPGIAFFVSEMLWNEMPTLPQSSQTAGVTPAIPPPAPNLASPMILEARLSFQDSPGSVRPGSLEVRDMSRPVSEVNTDFPPLHFSGLAAATDEIPVSFQPNPPGEQVQLWEEAARDFSGLHAELGDLARLAFVTLGWDEMARNGQGPVPTAVPREPVVEAAAVETIAPEALAEQFPSEETVSHEETIAEPESVPVEVQAVVEEPEPVAVAREETPQAAAEPEPTPTLATKPLPMTLHGHAPGRGKAIQVFPSAIARAAGVQLGRSSALPLRPALVFGAAPAKEQEAAPPAAPRKDPPKFNAKPEIRTIVKPSSSLKAAEPVKPTVEAKEQMPAPVEPKVEAKEAPPIQVKTRRSEVRGVPVSRKIDEPKPEPVKPEAPKPEIVKPEPVKAETQTVETKPEKKPVESPIPAPLSPSYEDVDLGLPRLTMEGAPGFWAKLPVAAKAFVAAALLAVLVGGGLYVNQKNNVETQKGPVVVAAGNVLSSGDAGWIADWAPDPANSKRQRRISVMRATQSLSDYRLEIEGQIETKAMGWVFRAANPRNFYVEKIEIVKPGLEPVIQVVRFAIVDGEEQPHETVPITVKVRPDTVYKIRFEAIGDRFTTWLLDQKVDEFTDNRIGTGGVGLYNEKGESLSLKGGLNVVPLVVKR